jgi:hypothetical protein
MLEPAAGTQDFSVEATPGRMGVILAKPVFGLAYAMRRL